MPQVLSWLNSGWSIAMVIIGLGMIVFLHELGHFLMAKKNGVRVEIFSLGFGQAIWKFRRGETEYRIAWLPLGGYVKMAGESLMDDRKGEPFELTSKTPWQRFQIFVAGAAMNLIIAFPIAILAYVVGKCEAPNQIGRPGISERRAGILPGDVILEVDGRSIDSLDKFRVELLRRANGTRVPVKLKRGEEIKVIDVEAMNSSNHLSAPPDTMILDTVPGSPLAQQGVQGRDEIVSVNGSKVFAGELADQMLRASGPTAELQFRRRGLTFDHDDDLKAVTLQMPRKTWYVIPRDERLMEAKVGKVVDNRPASKHLEPGDLILRIGDRKIESWVDMKDVVEKAAGKPLEFTVKRGDEQKSMTITPMMDDRGLGAIGVANADSNIFASVRPDSYFARMGVKSGDKIKSFDGFVNPTLAINKKDEVPGILFGRREDKPRKVPLEVEREGKVLKLELDPEPKEEADLAAVGFKTMVGPAGTGFLVTGDSQPFRRRPLGDAVKAGLIEPVDITVMTFDILKKLLTGGESAKGLSGPIGIIHASYSFAQLNFGNFVWLLCLITVNLGIFNLLPIPILDGGHNVLLLIEVVRKWFGKPPPSERFIAAFQYVGLAFILSLFVFVTFNDISRFVSRG